MRTSISTSRSTYLPILDPFGWQMSKSTSKKTILFISKNRWMRCVTANDQYTWTGILFNNNHNKKKKLTEIRCTIIRHGTGDNVLFSNLVWQKTTIPQQRCRRVDWDFLFALTFDFDLFIFFFVNFNLGFVIYIFWHTDSCSSNFPNCSSHFG